MAKSCSFDIVSIVDIAEVKNAVNQAMMEIRQRFDFKGSKSQITLEEKGNQITLLSDDDHKMKSVIDVLQSKLIRRKVDIKALDYGKPEDASGGSRRQVIKIQQGIPQDKGREIVRLIKGMKLKVQAQIIDDKVRISGKNKDDLQIVIAELNQKELDFAMQFINYR